MARKSILDMNPRELLAFLCEEAALVRDDRAVQILVGNAITRHQNSTKRAEDLLRAIKENADAKAG